MQKCQFPAQVTVGFEGSNDVSTAIISTREIEALVEVDDGSEDHKALQDVQCRCTCITITCIA